MRRHTIVRVVLGRALFALVLVVAIAALMTAPRESKAIAGSGSCSAGTCSFCGGVNLYAYGNINTADRCAYGHFVGANQVFVHHDGGTVYMCAGMKSDSDGGGTNQAPVGVTCSSSTIVGTPWSGDTAGYATIINHDNAIHYAFYGSAYY